MARVELAPDVLQDFDRFLLHLHAHEASRVEERLASLVEALDLLRDHPLIGRPVRGAKRELVIGQGANGYVALYRYVKSVDIVFVLAIRAQRESAFKRP